MSKTTYEKPPAVPTFWGLSTVVGHFDRFDAFYGRDSEDVLAIDL
jgi:hypothetical protein